MIKPGRSTSAAVLCLIGAGVLYFLFSGDESGEPVSLRLCGYQTNSSGQVSALVEVTNGSSDTLDVAIGTEILESSKWVDTGSGASDNWKMIVFGDPRIVPDTNRLLSVKLPDTDLPRRVYLRCQKYYSRNRLGRMLRRTAGFLRRGETVQVYYSEAFTR